MALLRQFNFLLTCVVLLYWSLNLLCPFFTQGPPEFNEENCTPCASICPNLNTIPIAFCLREFSVSQSNNSDQCSGVAHRSKLSSCFKTFFLLLLLSGDVELNPGPVMAPTTSPLKFAQFNCRSVLGSPLEDKPALIQNYIVENNIDILALSETWLKPNSLPATINSITPDGYTCMHVPRSEGRGGGVAFIYRSIFEFRILKYPMFSSFELIVGKLVCKSRSFIFANVYRPPSVSINAFIDEFSSFLEEIGTNPSDIFLSGDYNLRLDEANAISARFLNLLDLFDLHQFINFPTHEAGHTLDLFISRSSASSILSNFSSSIVTSSDHMAVSCDVSIPTTP